MRRLIAFVALALCVSARAELVNNPGLYPSAQLTVGNCIAATGPNSVASTGSPCGAGTGAGNVTGPTSSTIGNIATWSNGTGTGLADSGVAASSVAFLGANNDWGGINTFEVRPVFNGQTPYDTGNLPAALAPYLTIAAATSTYLTQANASTTYYAKTGGTVTGNITAPSLTLSAAAGTWKPISFNTGSTQRWQLGSDNSGESGANAGSDLSLFSYADNGAVLANNLHITRSTGLATFSSRPMFGAGVPWDSINLVAPLTSAQAAATYLTIAAAASTYTTPAEVNAALSTFLTIANAAATYLTPAVADTRYLRVFNGGAPVLGLGPFSNGVSGNSTAASFIAESGGGSQETINIYPNATTGLAAPGFPSQALSSLVQAGDTAILSVGNPNSTFVIGAGATNANSPAGIRFATASGGSIAMGMRPTFGGNLAWDAGNFNPSQYLTTANAATTYLTQTSAASTYLTQAAAASTYITPAAVAATYLPTATAASTYATIAGVQSAYMRLSGGTFTGSVQFNLTPTIANQSLPVTDSSPDVPTTSWVQAVITNRVGTGPFIPTSGAGMPYDIQIGGPGLNPPTGGTPVGTAALTYVFVRNVTIPAGFAGSKLMARANATNATSLLITSSRFTTLGTVSFAAGSSAATFSGSTGGPFPFLAGDTINIVATSSDATLGGFFGTLEGAISN